MNYPTLQNGLPPLHIACWQGHVNVVEILLKFGSQVDIQDKVKFSLVSRCISDSITSLKVCFIHRLVTLLFGIPVSVAMLNLLSYLQNMESRSIYRTM